jgi:hypothetical protein
MNQNVIIPFKFTNSRVKEPLFFIQYSRSLPAFYIFFRIFIFHSFQSHVFCFDSEEGEQKRLETCDFQIFFYGGSASNE